MEKKFKKGDWCFCEHSLRLIQEVEDDRVTEVTDGYSTLSSYDLSDRCFPMVLNVKRISDDVEYYYNKLHEMKTANLNYPDLHREYVRRWVEMCCVRNDDKLLMEKYESLASFHQSIIDQVNNIKGAAIEGVQIFR